MSARRAHLGRGATCAWLALCLVAGCSDSDTGAPDAGSLPPTDAASGNQDAASNHDAAGADATPPDAARDSGSELDARTAPFDASVSDKVCSTLGWCQLEDTKLASVCPDSSEYPEIQANEGCSGVINDWSGGIGDTTRQRLLVWGGGHRGYFGNELYALDLIAGAMQRLDDPSALTGIDLDECTPPEAYADGRPSSRHTYDGLAYIEDRDQLYAIAGSGIPCGYALSSTWTLDLDDLASWSQRNPATRPTQAAFGVVSDYDPATERVIVNDGYSLWSYDSASDSYAVLNDSNVTSAHIDYHMTGRVDPEHGLFVIFGGRGNDGGGLQVFDISSGSAYAQEDWTADVTGCDALLDASSPGLAFDTRQRALVGWAGGDDVYLFDPDAKTCTKVTHTSGPGPQIENGTFGRFRYFPQFNLFAVVNAYDQDAFTLRLTQ